MSTLPKWWPGAGFTAKAAWLCSSGRAKTYQEACAMLGKRRRAKPVIEAVRKPLWYEDRD